MLEQIINRIAPADLKAEKKAKERWDKIAKPLDGLGELEKAVSKIAGMTGDVDYRIDRRAVAVFCADNGVVAEGISQTGSEVTAIVAKNLCSCDTSVCKMARVADAEVFPIDMGMNTVVKDDKMCFCHIADGTQNMRHGQAMTREQAKAALQYGAELAVKLSGEGYKLFATGEMGIGNTTTSSAVASVLLEMPVETMTGRGAGLSSAGLLHKIEVIGRSIDLNKPDKNDPVDVLAKVGGFDIAGMAGFFLGCASCRRPVVIDGFISGVAALLASRICPYAREYMLPSHLSNEPAARIVLKSLELSPFITAGLHLGEGTGAVALFPMLDMAYAVYFGMRTFEDIKIDDYKPLD
ncbi:MAG: nicotinate-nucleotide--dimethylbenzimidazole phosphoribosyltransferase [Oscillospiraceae bacterium]